MMLTRPIKRSCPSRNCTTINMLLRQLAGLTNGIRPSNTRYSANAANKSLQIIVNQQTQAGASVKSQREILALITLRLVQVLEKIVIRIEHENIAALTECAFVRLNTSIKFIELLVLLIGLGVRIG